jgi:HK97 family phage portal protein
MGILDRVSTAFRTPHPDQAPFSDLRRQPSMNGHAPPERRTGLPTIALYRYGRPTWSQYDYAGAITAYDRVVVVFACVNLIADAAATARIVVRDEQAGDQPLDDHPLRALMRAPNPQMSEAEWINTNVKIAAVTGFCVNQIERGTGARPVALHPLRSDWLVPIPRPDNRVDWRYNIPGQREPTTLLAENVVAWTYQTGPLLGACGITPITAAGREIDIENEATGFVKAFFDAGAVPQLGLVPAENAEFNQSEADTLREKFKQFAGQPWVPIVMQAITDVKRLGFDLNEMAYADLRNLDSTQICSAFRVPPVMIGTLAGLENSPWSKYEEARRSFYEDTITPLWARLDGALTRSLLPEFETRPSVQLEFDTSQVPALRDDDSQVWTTVGAAVAQGWFPVNWALQAVGYPPVEGGDVFLRTIAQLEEPAIETAPPRRGIPGPDELRDRREWARLLAADPLALPPNGKHAHTRNRLTREIRARVAATSRETMLRIAERQAPSLRRFWRAQGRRYTTALFGASLAYPVEVERRAVQVLDWEEEDRQLSAVVAKLYQQNGQAAFDAASAFLGVDLRFDLANPRIRDVADKLGQRVSGINETTRADLARLVTDSLHEGVSMNELADRIQAQFDGYGEGRALTTARSESQVAYNSASVLGYRESGLVSDAELFDNPDHGDYGGDEDGLTCAERNGLVVPLAGVETHINGTHPNCILAVAPVLSTELGEA